MHFTKLKLSGFKSFVDTTELHIRPGLTGVVGPNGCGKSNLLEALRWVMGETSAKSMRGGAMDDVIFAGAASRPPRNYAEVTLSIDNTERRAPTAFNDGDGIEITRRITKELGSVYKHNGKDIRARDAGTLFADAATGANSPALVRQGQISELINAKPKARRRVLEDAAGIAGLYARRHEATLRLNSGEANLERVLELLGQLEAREAELTREAKRATEYREYASELRRAEAILLFRRWREADRERESAARLIDEGAVIAAEATRTASEAARKRIELEETTPAAREEEAIARALAQKLLLERQTLDVRARDAVQAADRLKATLSQLEADRERERAVTADARETLEQLEADRAALAEPAQDAADLVAAEEAERSADEARRAAEKTLEQLTAAAADRAAAAAGAKARLEASRRDAARAAAEAQEVEARRAALGETAEETALAAEETAAGLEAAEERAAEAEAALAEAEATRTAAEEERRAAQTAFETAASAAKALIAERDTMARLAPPAAAEGRPILDDLSVTPGYEVALGAALRDDLEAPEAARSDWGWRRLPPLSPPPPLPDGALSLADFVEGAPALARRLSQTGLVEASDGPRLQVALRPGQRLVSRDGAVWRWDGYAAQGGGETTASAELKRANRLLALAAEIEEAEAERDALAETAELAEEARLAAVERESAARETRRAAEDARAAARRAHDAAETARTQAAAQSAGLLERLEEKRLEAEAAAERLAEAESELEELTALTEGADADAALAAARAAVEEARETYFAAQSARAEIAGRAKDRTTRLAALDADLQKWRSRLDSAERQTAALAIRAEEAEAELADVLAAPEQIAEDKARIDADVSVAEGRLEKAVDALAVAEAALKETAKLEKEAEARLSETREGRARHETRLETAKERVQEFAAQLREVMGVEPEETPEKLQLDPERLPNVKDLERAISHLKQRRDAIGPVNLRADVELAEVSEKRASLAHERAELDAAIGKLRQGVQALNNESRARLVAAFEEVNKNFTTLFTHLFNGGDARLTLVDSEDPLEAGLEILCQPPGKRLTSLSLLSGGEQTLTAISLIFAVFMVNPAPICVLDEVDAPLDDANVTRFCDLLDEMTRRTKTRFLIITHHPVTMSRVDRLFGVTMVEKGVSQLVSVDLARAVDMVERPTAA
ncbi:MAG: AAA family ATPase [Pseudomonadota bacterium]